MSLSPAVLDAMLAAGCTADQIVATVKAALVAEQQAEEARRAAKREGNAERQQRFRDRRKERKETRNKNNALRAVTPPIEYIHTPKPDISPDGENQTERVDDCATVAKLWNEMAKPIELSACTKMEGKRRKACQARLRADGLEAIQAAIQRIPKSPFLRGELGNWAADIDFLLKPDSVTKILEGKYDDRSKPQAATIRAVGGTDIDRRSSLARAIDEGLDWLGGAQAGIS